MANRYLEKIAAALDVAKGLPPRTVSPLKGTKGDKRSKPAKGPIDFSFAGRITNQDEPGDDIGNLLQKPDNEDYVPKRYK